MNANHFNRADYDVRTDPLKSEIAADVEQLLQSSKTRKSLNGTERTESQMISNLIRGKLAEWHVRQTKKGCVRITEEVVREHLQDHPFYDKLLVRNTAKSLVNWQYHDIVDVTTGEIIEVKAWVNAKKNTSGGISELWNRMKNSNFFYSDRVYVFDYKWETGDFDLAYRFKWNVNSKHYELTAKGKGF